MNPQRLNQLRAAVLGANDGIISVATALVAVIGVFGEREIVLTALAVLLAGAISMASGEYISVSAQVHHEGAVSSDVATGSQAPLQAAIASFLAFLVGGVVPAALAIIFGASWLVISGALLMLMVSAALTAKKTDRIRSAFRLACIGAFALGVSLLANLVLHQLGV